MSTYRLTATRRAPVMKDYKAFHGRNYREIPQLSRLGTELIEAVGVGVLMGGGPGSMYAAHALDAIDQFLLSK